MSKPLRFGIAGYGVVGRRRDEFVQRDERVSVVAICDQSYRGRSGIEKGIAYHDNFQDLLSEDLDALFVCLPNYLAPEVTIAALEHGLHVFCEKPPGCNIHDVISVIETEMRFPNLKLKYGFNHRYHGSAEEALQIVDTGQLGAIRSIDCIYGKSAIVAWPHDLKMHVNWRSDRDKAGGGILLDQGIHLVDLIHCFAGALEVLFSNVSNDVWKLDVEDEVHAFMLSEKGAKVSLLSSANLHEHTFSLRIVFERGELILSGILSGSRSYGEERLTIVRPNEKGGGNPEKTIKSFTQDYSWSKEIQEFVDAILEGKPILTGNSDDALQSMQTVYAIYAHDHSWRERYNIQIPETPVEVSEFLTRRAAQALADGSQSGGDSASRKSKGKTDTKQAQLI